MDTSDFINTGLEEQIFTTYKCPVCGAEKEIAMEYLKNSKMFVPIHLPETLCDCEEDGDNFMEVV